MNLADLLEDLLDEQASLDEIVAPLNDSDWDLLTPSPRWSVTDQIGHLCYFDGAAAQAIRDPESFSSEARRLMEASLVSETSGDDFTLGEFRMLSVGDRLERWRSNRRTLAEAAGTLGERDRVSWYGPSMGAKSFVTARLMEVWAHGTDVCDTVGAHREPTHRLRHVAQLGYITRAWTYINRGQPAPEADVWVELTAPSGEIWTWGDAGAAGDNAVRGPALDFCLVVTQRRHVADTGLEVTGEHATDWLSKAQAFAGPPRPPGPERPVSAAKVSGKLAGPERPVSAAKVSGELAGPERPVSAANKSGKLGTGASREPGRGGPRRPRRGHGHPGR